MLAVVYMQVSYRTVTVCSLHPNSTQKDVTAHSNMITAAMLLGASNLRALLTSPPAFIQPPIRNAPPATTMQNYDVASCIICSCQLVRCVALPLRLLYTWQTYLGRHWRCCCLTASPLQRPRCHPPVPPAGWVPAHAAAAEGEGHREQGTEQVVFRAHRPKATAHRPKVKQRPPSNPLLLLLHRHADTEGPT